MADDRWYEDEPIYGDLRDAMEMLYDSGAPSPSEWDRFIVDIDYDDMTVEVSAVAGRYEYTITEEVDDLSDFGFTSWVWSAWDWLEDFYPDVDRESEYSED